jgi:hypothetical protein
VPERTLARAHVRVSGAVSRHGDYLAALAPLLDPPDAAALRTYLLSNSGLPGPRGNLELAAAFADLAGPRALDTALGETLADWLTMSSDTAPTGDPREFLVFCALQALATAYAAADAANRERIARLLRDAAGDARWRIREAAAMGLQRVGEADPPSLRRILDDWGEGATLPEQRAIVAALAHPPILDRPTALLALDVAARIMAGVRSLDAATRRTEEFRILSKGLEYAISVFVAAAPAEGFALLRELAEMDDRDVRRIVRSNLGKARIATPFPDRVAELLPLVGG